MPLPNILSCKANITIATVFSTMHSIQSLHIVKLCSNILLILSLNMHTVTLFLPHWIANLTDLFYQLKQYSWKFGEFCLSLKVVNGLLLATESRHCSIIIFLNLNTAFETVNHFILIGQRNGIKDSALDRLWSSFTDRSFSCVTSSTVSASCVYSMQCMSYVITATLFSHCG